MGIAVGVDAELDELRELSRSGRQALVAIEERERQRTGISSLKVRFNSVFGYYLEVTKANAKSVPADYERKQTLVNAERFTTPELKGYETKILTAQERSGEIERRLFAELRQLLDAAKRMRETARRVAEIDMLGCFAHLAALRGWTKPEVDASGVLEFVGARHPVVDRRLEESGGGRFVPNSVHLDADAGPTVLLITGPSAACVISRHASIPLMPFSRTSITTIPGRCSNAFRTASWPLDASSIISKSG